MTATQLLHQGEADGVGIGHGAWRQPLQPSARCLVVLGAREVNGHPLARPDTVEHPQGGLHARPEEREPVNLGEHEVGSDKRDASAQGLPEETIRLDMMLIAAASQRDPSAAIDEESTGVCGAAHGTERGAAQRRSR